jgi:hypothetical protein
MLKTPLPDHVRVSVPFVAVCVLPKSWLLNSGLLVVVDADATYCVAAYEAAIVAVVVNTVAAPVLNWIVCVLSVGAVVFIDPPPSA